MLVFGAMVARNEPGANWLIAAGGATSPKLALTAPELWILNWAAVSAVLEVKSIWKLPLTNLMELISYCDRIGEFSGRTSPVRAPGAATARQSRYIPGRIDLLNLVMSVVGDIDVSHFIYRNVSKQAEAVGKIDECITLTASQYYRTRCDHESEFHQSLLNPIELLVATRGDNGPEGAGANLSDGGRRRHIGKSAVNGAGGLKFEHIRGVGRI